MTARSNGRGRKPLPSTASALLDAALSAGVAFIRSNPGSLALSYSPEVAEESGDVLAALHAFRKRNRRAVEAAILARMARAGRVSSSANGQVTFTLLRGR